MYFSTAKSLIYLPVLKIVLLMIEVINFPLGSRSESVLARIGASGWSELSPGLPSDDCGVLSHVGGLCDLMEYGKLGLVLVIITCSIPIVLLCILLFQLPHKLMVPIENLWDNKEDWKARR